MAVSATSWSLSLASQCHFYATTSYRIAIRRCDVCMRTLLCTVILIGADWPCGRLAKRIYVTSKPFRLSSGGLTINVSEQYHGVTSLASSERGIQSQKSVLRRLWMTGSDGAGVSCCRKPSQAVCDDCRCAISLVRSHSK